MQGDSCRQPNRSYRHRERYSARPHCPQPSPTPLVEARSIFPDEVSNDTRCMIFSVITLFDRARLHLLSCVDMHRHVQLEHLLRHAVCKQSQLSQMMRCLPHVPVSYLMLGRANEDRTIPVQDPKVHRAHRRGVIAVTAAMMTVATMMTIATIATNLRCSPLATLVQSME